MAAPPQLQQRFCWRERTEKINWRMLRALHLPDVVRRGDPSVLEPYVLHLTFARLPAAAASAAVAGDAPDATGSGSGGAWLIVRVFQLAVEYLLFMRTRDGAVLETQRKQLLASDQEATAFAERAAKWKARAKSGDKQVLKLHQVLQNIAKLLQIQGATPSAVATIEKLLAGLAPQRKKRGAQAGDDDDDGLGDADLQTRRRVQEARQCFLCGKMFASGDFLEKHHVRRHPSDGREPRLAPVARAAKPVESVASEPPTAAATATAEQPAGEQAMHRMLQQVERALQSHEASLRSLAKAEAQKIKGLYEQLHDESRLVEEMKASRTLVERQVRDAQEALDDILERKHEALAELTDVKNQLEFLDATRKIAGPRADAARPSLSRAQQSDMAALLELTRLEQALALVNATLAESRVELLRLQDVHSSTLKEKQALADCLSEAQERVRSFETASRQRSGHNRSSARARLLRSNAEAKEQIEALSSSVPVVAEPALREEDPPREPLAVEMPSMDAPPTLELPSPHDAQPSDDDAAVVSNYVFNIVAGNLMDAVASRAQQAVEDSVVSRSPTAKYHSSLPGRSYLRSRYQHDERAVRDRIGSQLAKLEQLSRRFGVPPRSAVLSSEHLQVVQRALHGHLEILPTEVLQAMIECERSANVIIEQEWVPREKTRQLALERLKAQRRAKATLSQDLVKQAMVALAPPASAVEESMATQPEPTPPQPPAQDEQSVRLLDVEESVGIEAEMSTSEVSAVVDHQPLQNEELDDFEIVELESFSSRARSPAERHERENAPSEQPQQARSLRSSEFSASLVASSELSFQTSIPSLEESAEGASELGTSASANEGGGGRPDDAPELLHLPPESADGGERPDTPGRLADGRERTASSASSPLSSSPRAPRVPPYSGGAMSVGSSVMSFDESEIEEVELA
ncbi:hypothetical protein PybrP1_004534 [[Pythium] brassicae (nom. inval.)]|nr:hypothetical protein PybrP1_004534 [[Pythium] brassicae (nom. inval.)]